MADVKDLKIDGTKYNIKIPSANVKLMTGYSKGSSTNAITPSDSLNSAIGKLECRADADQANILSEYKQNGKTFNLADVYSASRNGSGAGYFFSNNNKFSLPAETKVYIVLDITAKTGGDVSIQLTDANEQVCSNFAAFTSTGHKTAILIVQSGRIAKGWNAYQNAAGTVEISNFMIIQEDAYLAGFTDFMPYSRPNYELTSGLVDVVDSGAKNILDFANASYGLENNITYTKTASDLTVSSSAEGGWSYVSYGVFLPVGNYVLSFKITNLTRPSGSNPMIRLAASKNGDYLRGQTDIGSNGQYSFKFDVVSAGTYYVIFGANWGGTPYAVSYKASDIMVCTKAAYGVSTAFVPHRVPITGLMSVVDKEISCSTSLTTTGIKFTATEKAAYRITATAIYYNSIPMKLAIKHKIGSGSTQGTLCTAVHVENEDVSLTVSGIRLLDVGGEFEIFAQYASSTNNRFYVLVEKLG